MCPCPFCATIALIIACLLPFKKTRNWLKTKMKQHHCHCEVCQKAEHEQNMKEHHVCHCEACQQKEQAKKCAQKTKKQGKKVCAKKSPKKAVKTRRKK